MNPLKKAQIVDLKADEVFTKIFYKYANFVNIFSIKLVVKLLKYIKINNHAIELVDN